MHKLYRHYSAFPKAIASLDANGSARPTFRMDPDRGFLTVRLEVHSAFAPKPNKLSAKEVEYRARIIEALASGPLLLSELSRAMGYKAISKRLTTTLDHMIMEGRVVRVATGDARSKLALVANQ